MTQSFAYTDYEAAPAEAAASSPIPQGEVANAAVLKIQRMPRQLRPLIEDAMVDALRSASQITLPGVDPLEANWFTQWRKSGECTGAVECRQLLTGTSAELCELSAQIKAYAREHSFEAELRLVD